MNVLVLAALAVLGAADAAPEVADVSAVLADTTVTVRQGDMVVLQNLSGDVRVEAWARDLMEVSGEDGDPVTVTVRRSGNRIVIRPEDGRRGRHVDLRLRLPPWVELEIGGLNVDVKVEGMGAGVDVQNISGDIDVTDGSGDVSLSTMEGEVTVEHIRGNVRVEAQSDAVTLEDVVGNVWVTSGDGDITLLGIDGEMVHAETVEGDVTFEGSIKRGGTYAFEVHEGDAELTVPSDTGAEVAVANFDGEFESDFQVRLRSFTTGQKFDFTLGGGGATVSIRVFDGNIRLRAGGE